MSLPMSGMYHTQTMGWAYSSGATRWVLIPGTLIALFSIFITVAAIVHHGGILPAHAFDPSDPLHLVAAAAAGNLDFAFQLRCRDTVRLRGKKKTNEASGLPPQRRSSRTKSNTGSAAAAKKQVSKSDKKKRGRWPGWATVDDEGNEVLDEDENED
ncbi:hypothetical protein B0H14DRAFT_2568271 [Mycena olivaceomarginata]|nr:hypothetical protein B0H14DRAFT_2568271 [Mycena olivaceomarginata]